ncbi:MAG TPA: phosphodiester glycosidase family protein [Acidimicrobiales bacterium]|nr:MAG: hypothetical protein B7Z69_06495 [Actinobacteria bacterium 21-73-9]HQU26658.1 phosphodiester glycosidase family protein [Acidimicrobiales bacterium]
MRRTAFALAVTAVLVPSVTGGPGVVGAAGALRARQPLPAPADLTPFTARYPGGLGIYRPVGRRVGGRPALFVTWLRLPGNPSTVAGVAWMDTHLLKAQLYSGSLSPGGLFWHRTAPVTPSAARTLVAAFNGGFLMKDSHGGYLSEGHLVAPLVRGGASLVIYRDGSATVGAWGVDVGMTPQVVAVRQNLTLLVDHGRPVPGLVASDVSRWGSSLNNVVDTPRSGLGVTKDGALVYVEGPMNIVDLARVLVRAGAVRAMALDMNPFWTIFAYYTPSSPTGLAGPGNGHRLNATMVQSPDRFFQVSYARDFVTMSAAG